MTDIKKAVLSYHNKKLCGSGKNNQWNLGDWFQTLAVEYLYRKWGIEDYLYVNKDDASIYNGENVVLPINCYHSFANRTDYQNETFPLSAKIKPIFFSIRVQDNFFPQYCLKQFSENAPIGCRDEETYNKMKYYGIDSFISGCVTITFPRREEKSSQKKIIMIDAPKSVEEFIPSELRRYEFEYMMQIRFIENSGETYTSGKSGEEIYELAKEQLRYIADNAKLVVTARLHVASPCIAMGIPVILVRDDDFSERYSWIDKYIKLYNREHFNEIDWNPGPIDCEKEKSLVESTLKRMILGDTADGLIENDRQLLNDLYLNRNRYNYDCIIRKSLSKFCFFGCS